MMLRTEPTAEDSLAAILARSRFGMAIAAMIKMIATTISNSINEKPFCLRILVLSLFSCFFESSVSATRWQYLRTCLANHSSYQSQSDGRAYRPLFNYLRRIPALAAHAVLSLLTNFVASYDAACPPHEQHTAPQSKNAHAA